MANLVLVTNQFPGGGGDSTFVFPEIGPLAREFDEVYILAYHRAYENAFRVLPDNVRPLDAVFASRWQILCKGLFNGQPFRPGLLRVSSEIARIRGLRSLFRLLWAVLAGRAIADRVMPLLRTLPNPVIYFYWGAWGAYCLPWITESDLPVAVRFHGGDLYAERANGYLPLRDSIVARANLLLPISEHGASYLRSQYGAMADEKMEVAKLGTFDQGVNPPSSGELARDLVVVSCSSVSAVKRVDRIYRPLCRLAEDGYRVQWVHFGDGPLMQVLRDTVADGGENVSVTLAGQVAVEDVALFYQTRHVDVFINVSSSEGLPVSIMEAMSCDIPIVATAVGGTPELVRESRGGGVLVDVDFEDEELAAAVVNAADLIAQSPGARRELWSASHRASVNADALARRLRNLADS